MLNALTNMNDPLPEFALHRALLDDARSTVTDALQQLGGGVDLDELVVVVVEPRLAAQIGRRRIDVKVLDAVLPKVSDPTLRAVLRRRPAPGFVRVVLFAGTERVALTMRVRPGMEIVDASSASAPAHI